jgi:hypothetical protein
MAGFQSNAISAQGVLIKVESGTLGATKVITAITKAAQAVVSCAGHGFTLGQIVQFASVVGMVEINGLRGTVVAAPTDTFTVDIDSTGFTAYGSGGTAAPVVYVDLCEVKTFTGFDGQASEIDVTTICSDAKEVRLGLQDFGAFSFEMNYVPDDPGQMQMQSAKASGVALAFRFVLPGTYGAWNFNAYVKAFPIAGGVDGVLTSSVSLRISGAPTFVPGA